MEIISITPAVKIVKEDSMAGRNMYVGFGDRIRIIDFDGNKFEGRFLYMNLGKCVEEDDAIVLDIENENVEFQCSYIKNIEEL